jgi:polyhydroxybutyrate depolymerase
MFRLILISFFVLLSFGPAMAENFMGRKVIITDGRTNAAPAPLVIAMHGFLGNGANMQKKTRFDALARKHGFVAVYPNGKGRKWNDGRSARNRVDDVGYLSALIGSLVAKGTADPKRVYLTGHSNGGGMAMRMACDRPDLVRAISVVATKSPIEFQCGQGQPVPALFIHGTLDPISPHAGRSGASRLGGALSSAATLDLWQRRNRCNRVAKRQVIDKRNDGTSAEVVSYGGCKAALSYIEITGHGHDWPRAGARATRLQGPATQEIDGAAYSWWFFQTSN